MAHHSFERSIEMTQLLSQQTFYIDQLKKENALLVEELKGFKQRLAEVVEENQVMHDDVQSKIMSETVNQSHAFLEQSLHPVVGRNTLEDVLAPPPMPADAPSKTASSNTEKYQNETWLQELRELKALYNAKSAGMEAQINTTKRHLQSALEENETLKHHLEQLDQPYAEAHRETSDKIKNEKKTVAQINLPLIERLTKERNDLMKTVTSLRASLNQGQIQEVQLRQEIQRSLAVLEDIQLEKTKEMVEKEQLREALHNTEMRLDHEINEAHKRVLDAASQQRSLCAEEINDLQRKVGELMASSAHYEESLEKCAKEKTLLLLKLDESKAQLLQSEKDLSTMRVEVEHEVRSALKGYTGAEQELRETKRKLEDDLMKVRQERSRYEKESYDLRQRVTSSEEHALKLQELNVELTQQLNQAKTEAAQADQLNIRIKKKHKSEMETLQSDSTDKLEEVMNMLNCTEAEYEKRLSDLEDISSKQSGLISRLRSECKNLQDTLNLLSSKFRVEVGELTQQLEIIKERWHRLQSKNKELTKQCMEHGVTHRKMQERLQEVNNRARHSTNQVLQMLDRHNEDVKAREFLSKEVQFLHSQVMDERHS